MSTSLIVQHWFDEDLDPPAGAAAQIGQPWYLWRQHPRLDAEEDIYRKPNHHSLLTRQIVLVGITISYTIEVPDFASAEWVDAYEVQKHALQPFRWYAPTVTGRWPWYLWRPTVRLEDVEDDVRRSDSTVLHRYRQAFQTVGQSYRLWSIPKVRLEPEEYAQTKPADLSPFRQITATPTGGQPWYLWSSPKIEWDIEVQAPKANHDLLHRYRFAFQTVGQSWQYWIKPPARIDDEPNAPARIQDLSPFRTTAPAVQPGQPWFMFPAAEPDLTIEADAVRTDHAAALYPFRPHPETPPPEPVVVIVSPEPGSVPGWVPDSEGRLHGPYKRPGQVFGETFPLSPDLGSMPPPATLDVQYVSLLQRMSEGIDALSPIESLPQVSEAELVAAFALWAMMESDGR